MSLLQPQRETYDLFDDVMLLAEGTFSCCFICGITCGMMTSLINTHVWCWSFFKIEVG